MMADSSPMRIWFWGRLMVSSCMCKVRFLMRTPYCTLDRRRCGLRIIEMLLALSASCVFPSRLHASLPRTYDWLFSLMSANCLGPRLPAVMFDGWFAPMQAVSLADLWAPRREAWSWRPRKCYKDQLKRHLVQAGISHQSWQQEASDRDSWYSLVREDSRKFEAERHEAAKEKCRRQKERAASLPSSSQTFVCPKCCTVCLSRIGLYSHQRACKNWPSTFLKILVCEESAIIIRIDK